jgi:signal transduction protein with GAF and PtsI domain
LSIHDEATAWPYLARRTAGRLTIAVVKPLADRERGSFTNSIERGREMEDREIPCFALYRNICRVINSTLDIHEVLKLMTANIVKALDVKGCVIRLLNRKRQTLEVSASHGVSEAYLNKGPVDADKSIAETMEGRSILIYDTAADPRLQYPEAAKQEGIASILSVPITVKGEVIGALRIYASQPRRFSDDEMELIFGLAEMGGIAIDNARMYSELKADHEKLINDVHQWFEFGRTG